jgi:3-oxoacyl-[acyl-carrier protein] reductase
MTMPADSVGPLAGRVVLITGASGGIGQALGRRLAAEGARLALSYGANAAPAKDLAAEIVAAGGHAVPIAADLRDAEAAVALIEATEDMLGPVEVLVSNAGLGRRQSLEEIAVSDFDDMLAVNLRSPFLLAQRVVPGMRERGFGRILFVSSVAAFTGGSVGPHYAASKAGLHSLAAASRSMRSPRRSSPARRCSRATRRNCATGYRPAAWAALGRSPTSPSRSWATRT